MRTCRWSCYVAGIGLLLLHLTAALTPAVQVKNSQQGADVQNRQLRGFWGFRSSSSGGGSSSSSSSSSLAVNPSINSLRANAGGSSSAITSDRGSNSGSSDGSGSSDSAESLPASTRQLFALSAKQRLASRMWNSGLRDTYNWPSSPYFDNPWVLENVAITYGHKVKDGIGSQVVRMIAVYAIANITGIGHLFRPLGCVGHIGSHVHYRSAACNFTEGEEARLLAKARDMIDLPSTIPEAQVSSWQQKLVRAESFKWTKFLNELSDVVDAKRPTLFLAEHVNSVTTTFPDLFYALPQLRPSEPAPQFSCKANRGPTKAGVHSKPWLLDALRFAIHVRRGDVVTDGWTERILSTQYYISLAKAVTAILDEAGCQYSVEIHIETPRTPELAEELKTLKDNIPNAVMLPGKDLFWTWQMMASADILVMSNSMFSVSAALLNPDGISIHVPPRQAVVRQGMFKLRHWLAPLDENGTLSAAAVNVIRNRAGLKPAATLR